MKHRHFIFLCFGAVIAALAIFSPPAFAGECQSCIARKQEECSKQCRLVPTERSLECQETCVRQYCAHRCDPEGLNEYFHADQGCEACLDQQYNLCDASCPTGSDRYRCACKLGCAKIRCLSSCANQGAAASPAVQKNTPIELKLEKEKAWRPSAGVKPKSAPVTAANSGK